RVMYSHIKSTPSGQPTVLCRSGSGEVRACPNCGDMELAFGNVVIGLARSDLSLFLRRIAELQALPPSARIPVLYLTDTGLGVRFSREELLELRELLESALLLG